MSDKKEARVRSIGGVFFRSADPDVTKSWYAQHLGLAVDAYGTNFGWRHKDEPDKPGFTQWSPFEADTTYFGDQQQQFMINYRVDNLAKLLEKLQEDGVEIVGEIQHEPFGKFVHIIDNDGRRIELWEPVDSEYEKIVEGETK